MGNQGSLCCAGRSKKLRKGISKELEDKNSLLEDLRRQSTDLQTKISPQDGHLIQERFRTTEKNFTDLKQKIGKYQENVGNLGGQLEDIQNEAQKYLKCLKEAEGQIKTEASLSFQPGDVEMVLKERKMILQDLDQKQKILNGIIEKAQCLGDLPSKERDSMEQLFAMVQSQHNAVYSLVTEKCEGLQTALSVREEFLTEINKETEWLEDREVANKKMEILRLLSSDVQKQFDKYKKFVSKVKSHTSHIEEIEQTAGSIKEECNEESQSEIDSIVSDLRNRFDGFVQSLENQKKSFKDSISSRKSFEGGCRKVENWCDETEAISDDKLPQDCAIELVEERHKQYKNLSNMSVEIGELLKNTMEMGESFKDGLLDSDIPVLQQQLDNIQDRYDRATSAIDSEIKDLERKMEERSMLEQKIEESTIWFSQFQQELRLLSKTTASSVEDSQKLQQNFQDLEKKLAEYKPKLEEIDSQLDNLRSSGQVHNVEAILSLNNQYEQFIDQITQYENDCQQTMFIRQQFDEQTTTLESSLKQCEDEIQIVNQTELPLSERLDRYKVITEKLASTQPEVFIALDKAQQLKIDQSTEDSEDLKKVETIKLKLESMKSSVEEKTTQYKSLQKENDDFNSEIDKNAAWLDEKDDVLASCGSLDLDPEKVASLLKKHQKLSQKAEEKIEIMKSLTEKEKLHYEELQEPMSSEVETKLQQIETLQTNIQGAINRKEEYLKEGIKDREQYKNSVSQVMDWIHGAEDLLDSGYDGIDYDTLDQTLSEYTDYFNEASLCQDEVEQITELADKLAPTLDINDKETTNQSINNINQKLSNILVNSQNKQELLESKTTEWKTFLENVSEMNEIMDSLESKWEILEDGSVNDPSMVQTQLQSTQEFLEKIEEKRPMIGELNDKSRNLERSGNVNSRNLINGFMTNVNHRWSSLVTLAETKHTNLKEISSQWEGFSGTMSTVEDILCEAEVKLSTVNIDLITYTELIQQVNTLQEVSELLNEVEPQISVMKKSSENLQKTLPTAESKIHSQDTSIALLEKYERISSETKEQLQTVQDELEDRESFRTDIQGITDWFTVIKSQISSISPTLPPTDILSQLKSHEQEINMKVTEAKKLEQLQETKYKAQGRELPEDMLIQLSTLKDTESEVRDHLKQTSELLLHLKEDRVVFTETLSVVTNWLTNAETELQKPIKNITESMAVHKTLISNLDSFKGDLDKLRQKGGDIIRHTSDGSEKQTIQINLSDVNRQWNSVQSKIAEKTRKLNEALELQTTFVESTVNIKQWVDSAAVEIGQDVNWSEFQDVRDVLRNTQKVSKDINQNKEKLKSLNPVVKQLNHLIEPDDINITMTTLTQQLDDLQNQTTNKLSTLQDTNKQVEAYERDMADITRWLDHAKNVLSARDASHDLKEELHLSEKLLKDATSNKEKAQSIIQKHKELAIDVFPAQGSKVLTEICQLEAEVSDRVEQLQTAVDEQEQYQTELSDLNTAVLEAQQKLLASPVMASSVEALKIQIAEHDIHPGPELPRSHSNQDTSLSVEELSSENKAIDDNQLLELNKSWNNLQKQADAKEKALLVALSNQESYQQSVQDITNKMEQIQTYLFNHQVNYLDSLDDQVTEHQIILGDINSIKTDIEKIRQYGRSEESDPEGCKTIKSTLNILTDKIQHLQDLAENKNIELQNAVRDMSNHKVELERYKDQISRLDNWCGDMMVEHSESPLPTDTITDLQQQLLQNEGLQEDINDKLHQISDLAVQCDRLCTMEPPITAEKLRSQLALLQQQLTEFKLSTIEKQSNLRQTIKEVEKREREMSDYDKNMKHIQQWMTDSKQMTLPPEDLSQVTAILPQQVQLQKDLVSDISEHKLLLTDISESGQKIQENFQESTEPIDRTEELQTTWDNLQKDLELKKRNLEDSIHNKEREVRRSSIQYRPWTYTQDVTADTQLVDVQKMIADLNTSWSELNRQTDDKQLRLDQAIAFQQLYQNAILSISGWLDSAEQKLFSADLTKSTDEQIKENEALQAEIQALQKEISTMNNQAQDLLSVSNVQHGSLIKKSLSNLNNRVETLESHAQNQATELQEVNAKWKKYQTDVEKCQKQLADAQTLVSHHSPSWSVDDMSAQIQRVESNLEMCEKQMKDLKNQEKELASNFPHGVPSELNSLQISYMDIQRKLTAHKSVLQQFSSKQEQYESLLDDYSQYLQTAESKLKTTCLSATDLHHLKQQFAAHKDFFSDLESHKAMLDHLAEQCSKTVQDKHRQEHSRLTNSTHVIVDQASLHGQKLDRLNKQWSELEDKFAAVKRSLTRIEHDIPKPVATGDSLKTIEDKLAKLMRLQKELSNEKSSVFQVVDVGKQLLHSVTCPQLETSVADLADKWVDLNTSLSHELKRTETLGDELQRFEAEASILASWLATANTKIMSLKKLSKKEKKSIAGVRGKVEKLLEFQKEVENQVPFKNKVLESGHELLSNKTYNTAGLIGRLKKFERDWETLQNDINDAEKYLHKEQMARMPSRQALQELEDWLEEIKQSLRDDPHKTIKTVSDVDMMLRKYKDYKVELASKQITIDFVNQSILQPQEEEEETEKVAFAEKLGGLNTQWQIVSGNVNKRLDFLEQLQAQWGRFEHNFTALEKWFIEQNQKLNVCLESGRDVGAFETRTDIKAIRQALCFKETEISKFKDQGDRLMELCHDSPGIQRSVQSHVGAINKELVNLEKRLVDLDNVVESRTGLWSRYQSELQALNTLLSQTEYCLNNYQLIGGDVATLRSQVDKLKTRESELVHNKPQLEAFLSLSQEHCKNCEANVKIELQKTAKDIQNRWQKLSSEVRDRRMIFEARLKQWQKYDDEYVKLRNLFDEKERECSNLKSNQDETNPVYLERCKNFQLELDNIQVKLSDLYQLSDDLTKHMDQSTISVLSSRQTILDQRLIRLRQQLSHHIESLSEDNSQLNNFHDAYDVIKTFLSHAESILAAEDPQKTADSSKLESRLDQLKDLLMQFNVHMIDLDTVNNLGYRLALKPVDANRMQELNHKWYRLISETSMRCKMLQGNVVVHQDFTAKCESWKSFLAQTEQDLSLESAGNLADLIEQQIKCEKFNAEKYSREQVLHGILSDGQQLLKTGDVDNAEEFQEKLHRLADQWQMVVRRANRRKDIIDNHISQWQIFNDLSEKLRNWLSDKDHSLQRIDYHNMTMLQIKNQLHDINTTKEHFKLKENDFKKVNDIGNILLEQADLTASKEIKVCLAQLEHSWYQVYSQLEEHRVRLEDLIKQWHDCEEDIDDILAWLKETRAVLEQDVPDNYDDIQREKNRCKDIEVAFIRSEDTRQKLLAREASLGIFIQSEDMNILNQRIRLMNKQWEELSRQMSLRLTRLDDNTGRWTAFSERVRWFIEWMNKMEEKCIGGRDIHVEDHIHKLDTEIKEEMKEKEKIKNELIEEGKILSSSSSDIRANDIDSKTERVENKWQHLCQVVNFRERKLQETLLAVKQLDNSTKNLEKWLGNIEVELNTPIVYHSCDMSEIQKQLEHHQDLQRDIERHSAGVASVLNLCQVLLHDTDACPTEVEFNTLQTTMESLETRWSNICQQSPMKRTRIEETWKIWEKFRQSTDNFSDWLDLAESEIRRRDANLMSLSSREEINKYETLQKNIRSQITHLENINKQYRHMAKAGLTDTKGKLKSLMQDVNSRWDRLQQKSSATAKELRQSTETKDEYNTLRLRLVSWLRETELRVTDLEHLSELDDATKLEKLKQIESEIENRKGDNSRLEDLAALLRLNGDSQQVTLIQTEIEEYRDYYRDIIDRIKSFRKQLEHNVSMEIEDRTRTMADRQQTIQMEGETVEYMTTERHTTVIQQTDEGTIEWDTTETEEYLRSSPPESPKRRRIPGRRTPRSARSPSRWAKHSESPIGSEERRHKTDHRSKNSKVEALLENLAETIDDTANKLSAAERELQTSQALGQVDRTERFIYYMDECEEGMNKIQTLDRLIKTESGLNTIASADSHIRILTERWERLQEGNVTTQIHHSERPDHIQFITDMNNMLDWLEETEALLSSFQPLPSNMIELERIVRQFKDLMVQFESKKMRVTSINLISRNYIDDKTQEGRELRDKLHVMNRRYENVCARVNDIQQELQSALTDSSEFHHTVQDLLLWLENVETKLQQCEPINVDASDAVLWEKYHTLKDIQGELERKQDKALTLKETADQLLLNTDSTEMVNAKDKTNIIVNRLRALLRLSNSYISSLEGRLDLSRRPGALNLDESDRASSGLGSSRTSRQGSPYYQQTHPPGSLVRTRNRSPFAVARQLLFKDTRPSVEDSPKLSIVSHDEDASLICASPFCYRVLRAALPFQILMFLLLGLACLLPICEDDYSCTISNSFNLMLRYINGSPPT